MSTEVVETIRCVVCMTHIDVLERGDSNLVMSCTSPILAQKGIERAYLHVECALDKCKEVCVGGIEICRGTLTGLRTRKTKAQKSDNKYVAFHLAFPSVDNQTMQALRRMSSIDQMRRLSDGVNIDELVEYCVWESRLLHVVMGDPDITSAIPLVFVHGNISCNCMWFDLRRTTIDTAMTFIQEFDSMSVEAGREGSRLKLQTIAYQLLGVLIRFVRDRSYAEWAGAAMDRDDDPDDLYSPQACAITVKFLRAAIQWNAGMRLLGQYEKLVCDTKMAADNLGSLPGDLDDDLNAQIDDDDYYGGLYGKAGYDIDEEKRDGGVETRTLRDAARDASNAFNVARCILHTAPACFHGIKNGCLLALDTGTAGPKKRVTKDPEHKWTERMRYFFLHVRAYAYISDAKFKRARAYVRCAERNGGYFACATELFAKASATSINSFSDEDIAVHIHRGFERDEGNRCALGWDPLNAISQFKCRGTSALHTVGVPVAEPQNKTGICFVDESESEWE